jgi:hypothetical protein
LTAIYNKNNNKRILAESSGTFVKSMEVESLSMVVVVVVVVVVAAAV